MAGEWIAQMSDDLKGNEAFTPFETLSDFAKAHLDTVGKVTELNGKATEFEGKVTDLESKLANSIPKLGENATDEDRAVFYKALGVPEKPDEYEFPKGEGIEHDEKMVFWARDIFHKANLSKDQAGIISQAWDGLIQGMAKEQDEAKQAAVQEADTKLKTEWGADYDKNLELTKRGFQKFSGQELDAFCEETGVGNHPTLIKIFYEIGKAMGEDTSPFGKGGGGGEPKVGIQYDMPDFSKGG